MMLSSEEIDRLAKEYIKFISASEREKDELEKTLFEVYDIRDGSYPEDMWPLILKMLILTDDPILISQIAAGPLEDFLSTTPSLAISLVEKEVKNNPKFKVCLRSVWQNLMPSDIWKRVQEARR